MSLAVLVPCGPYVLGQRTWPEKYGIKLKVVLKRKDVYIEDIRMVSLIVLKCREFLDGEFSIAWTTVVIIHFKELHFSKFLLVHLILIDRGTCRHGCNITGNFGNYAIKLKQ